MELGLILRNKRVECGLLQSEVAKKMGLSQKTISSWEIGRTIPKLSDYEKLSKIFGCSINELTGRKDYDISTLSAHDILLKLPDLDTDSLIEITERAQKLIQDKKEKDYLLEQVKMYEKRIKELEGR